MARNSQRPVVFLDRDGTINIEAGYLRRLEDLNLIDGAGEAIARLNQAGVVCVLTTNQSGAARGYYPEDHIKALHTRLTGLLAQYGARLDAIYYCPHLSPAEGGTVPPYNIACDCRKPQKGMVDRAVSEIAGLNMDKAFVVGDKNVDVEMAKNSKITGVLVETGYGKQTLSEAGLTPDHVASSLVQAADWIIDKIQA